MEEYLHKYFLGIMTDPEKERFFEELEKDAALKEEFAALQNSIALSGLMEEEGDERMASVKLKELKRMAAKRRTLRLSWKMVKYAAMILLVIGTWLLSKEYNLDIYSREYTWVQAPKGQRVYVTLADGTTVWLNPCTRLKVPNVFDARQRIVELEGEGFFKVMKNAEAPFIVKTDKYDIRVLGTEFNVFAYPDRDDFETELVTGSVYICDREENGQGIYLKPDEKAIVLNGRLHKLSSEYKQRQLQTSGIYTFGDQPFGELLKRLELWYEGKFIVKNPEILKQVYSGKFRQNDSIESILQAIKDVGKFQYRYLQPIITQYFIDNKSEIWLLFLIAHSKR